MNRAATARTPIVLHLRAIIEERDRARHAGSEDMTGESERDRCDRLAHVAELGYN